MHDKRVCAVLLDFISGAQLQNSECLYILVYKHMPRTLDIDEFSYCFIFIAIQCRILISTLDSQTI